MSAINLTDFKKVLSKTRDHKKKIKGLLALKKKLEKGEFLEIAIMAMLKEEKKVHSHNSTLAQMETVGGIQRKFTLVKCLRHFLLVSISLTILVIETLAPILLVAELSRQQMF